MNNFPFSFEFRLGVEVNIQDLTAYWHRTVVRYGGVEINTVVCSIAGPDWTGRVSLVGVPCQLFYDLLQEVYIFHNPMGPKNLQVTTPSPKDDGFLPKFL